MRKLLVVASLSILAPACGSDTSNPVAACNSFAAAICNKASSCGVSGITSSCQGSLENSLGCANFHCTSGSFDSGAASSCINDINGLSCTDAGNDLDTNTLPSSCDNVCH